MTSTHAVSSYAPLRRNSFLHTNNNGVTTLVSRLSTFTVALTLLILRFWKDAGIWRDVVAKLPFRLQILLFRQAQSCQKTTTGFVQSALNSLVLSLQEQLDPFWKALNVRTVSSPTTATTTRSSLTNPAIIAKKQPQQQQQHTRINSRDGSDSTALTLLSSDYYEDRIRQNHCLIAKVLHYWFGQYDPDTSQKQMWMIASSSTDLRARVDAEIANLFAPLLCELGTASGNSHISLEDGTLQPCRWKQWCADKELYGYRGKLAAIIVLDQFSRHIRRHQEEQKTQESEPTQQQQQQEEDGNQNIILKKGDETEDEKEEKTDASVTSTTSAAMPHFLNNMHIPPQKALDALALRTAQLLTQGHAQEIKCGMIPLPQYVFGLMPYRHASTLESVQYVQTCVEQAANLNLQFEGMTSRFRKATNRRMAVLQDEARRTGKATTTTSTPKDTSSSQAALTTQDQPQQHEEEDESWEPIPPTPPSSPSRSVAFCDEDILETFPFEADMSDAHDHPVVRIIEEFLSKRGIYPTTAPAGNNNNDKEKHQTQTNNRSKKGKKKGKGQKQQQPKQQHAGTSSSEGGNILADGHASTDVNPCSIIVSLSGGVDSMVIASVLAFLKKDGGYPQLDIVGIHIDYANRPESRAESDYVEQYCAQHGIRFCVRRIEEVTRGITARDEYEQLSRRVRYDMYRTVAKECADNHHYAADNIVGVMLGHHRGDLRENVLSNAHKGCGPLDLSGMTSVSQNDGVIIYRPLLPLEKHSIFDYAHKFGVPYFKGESLRENLVGKSDQMSNCYCCCYSKTQRYYAALVHERKIAKQITSVA